MEQLTKHDISKRLQIPIRTVKLWTDMGLVIPDLKPSRGKGKTRLYSERNLIEFAMVKFLAKSQGASLTVIKEILSKIRKTYPEFYEDPEWEDKVKLFYIGDLRNAEECELKKIPKSEANIYMRGVLDGIVAAHGVITFVDMGVIKKFALKNIGQV